MVMMITIINYYGFFYNYTIIVIVIKMREKCVFVINPKSIFTSSFGETPTTIILVLVLVILFDGNIHIHNLCYYICNLSFFVSMWQFLSLSLSLSYFSLPFLTLPVLSFIIIIIFKVNTKILYYIALDCNIYIEREKKKYQSQRSLLTMLLLLLKCLMFVVTFMMMKMITKTYTLFYTYIYIL